jgi:hypothetical protein
MRNRWAWALAGALWLSGCFGPKGAKVQNPAPVAAAASIEVTEQVILDTLPKRSWTAETVEQGRIVAFLPVRAHLLRVEIRYDEQRVAVTYLDSDNLNEERKGADIFTHKKVNGWMALLSRDLAAALAQAPAGATSGGSI